MSPLSTDSPATRIPIQLDELATRAPNLQACRRSVHEPNGVHFHTSCGNCLIFFTRGFGGSLTASRMGSPPAMRSMPMARWLLPGAGAPDQHHVALVLEEGATAQVPHEFGVDRRAFEDELLDLLGQRELGNAHLVAERAGVLLGNLSPGAILQLWIFV